MRERWTERINRAEQLAATGGAAASLLVFYRKLLGAQQRVYEALRRDNWRPCGSLERDVEKVAASVPALLREVAESGPDPIATDARRLLGGGKSTVAELLLSYWTAPSDRQFFAKAALQPYAGLLAELAVAPEDRHLTPAVNRCPFCGGAPQLSVLRTASDVSSESGGRTLVCATCLGVWPFRRVLCPSCGADDEPTLGYFHSPSFEHLRVDVCEACRRYIKTVDLTRLGVAVPLVDEIAGAPLDLWAREQGYEKIELNLVGL